METLPIRVLVADDHRVVRAGVLSYLAAPVRGIHFIVEEAETVAEALAAVRRMDFDVVLMDYEIKTEGGPWATERILRMKPRTRVLALSIFQTRFTVKRMIQAGASGYLLKNAGPEVLQTAIKTVINGGRYYSNEVYARLGGKDLTEEEDSALAKLTEKEREILRLIAQGLEGQEIAQQMYISPRTVGKHREHIRLKTNAHNTAELVQVAVRLGLLG